jgi:hypothetical protein
VTLAGGDPASIFSREAVIAVYERSRGIPRSINVVCDNALLSAFALDRKPIGSDIVAEVGDDFDLTPEAASSDDRESESAVARFLREGEDEDDEGSRSPSDDERHAPLRWREQERRAR